MGHRGGAPGISSNFRRYIDDQYTVIILSNYDQADESVSLNIQAILFDRDYRIPTKTDAIYQLGFALEMRGLFRKAIREYAKNLNRDKPHKPSLYQSARAKILGKFSLEKAIEQMSLYIKLVNKGDNPTAADAWWRKGVAHELMGRKEESVRCHKMAVKLNPNHWPAKRDIKRLKK